MAAPVVRHQILDGKYRVLRIIAEGGMGVLVEAVHLALEHRVALKFPLVPAGVDEDEARWRLRREARAAAKLKGEHVCRIFDVCELESGEPYLVMELLEGADLGARVGQQMAVREAAELVRQACLGVGEAHARGIVHRDLKPENLFVTADHLGRPSVKVLDFGISKVTSDGRRTRDGATTRRAMGSPLYMSPEQMLATSDVDGRADVWSLGVILYELVAGVAPFDAPSIPQICVRVMREPPRPLLELRPDIPEAFAALVHRCLEKDATARAVDAAHLARELAPFARGGVEAANHGRTSTAPSSIDPRLTAAGVAFDRANRVGVAAGSRARSPPLRSSDRGSSRSVGCQSPLESPRRRRRAPRRRRSPKLRPRQRPRARSQRRLRRPPKPRPPTRRRARLQRRPRP